MKITQIIIYILAVILVGMMIFFFSSCQVRPVYSGSYLPAVKKIEHYVYKEVDYVYKMKVTVYGNGKKATEILASSRNDSLISGNMSFRLYDHSGNGNWDYIRFYDQGREFTFSLLGGVKSEFQGNWPVSSFYVEDCIRRGYKAKKVISRKGVKVIVQ